MMIPAVWGLALIFGFLFCILGVALAESVLRLIHTPEDAFSQAVFYLRVYSLGCPALLIYDFAAGILRAYGDSRRPLLAMIFSGIINLILNLFFVIICKWGVAGVALATDISTVLSACLSVKWVMDGMRDSKSEKRKFHLETASEIIKIGLPAAVQGAVFCFANIFVQSAVNGFGTTVVAGATAAMNFEYLTYYAITAFGQTATTFTGQNFSAGNRERCRKTALYCVLMSALLCALMTVPLCVFRYQAAGLFSKDNGVIEAAAVRIITILLCEPLCACYESLSGALRGMGHSLLPAIETIVGTCVFRILWIQTVFPLFGTQRSLYIAFPISWVLTSILVGMSYFRRIQELN